LKSAGNAIVSTAKAGVAAITGTGAKAATTRAAAGSADDVARAAAGAGANVADDAAKAGLKGGAGLFGKLLPGLATGVNLTASAYRYSQGDTTGGTLSLISAIPIIGWGGVGVDVAREFGAFEGTFLGKNQNKKTPPKAAVTPQTPVVPKNKAPNAPAADGQSFNETMGNLTSQASQIDWTKPAQFGEVNMNPEQGTPAQVSSQPAQANIKTPAQTSKIATLPLNVGPAPEPTPNVVYKRIGSSAQQQSGAAPTGGSVNEVPAISASNPDNFYVLYSQVNYNVVT
jgi:hypothetical protein